MSAAETEAWKGFIAKLELELAKLKADLTHYESSSMELRKTAAPPADTRAELSRFRQGIANMEAVIEANRHRAK